MIIPDAIINTYHCRFGSIPRPSKQFIQQYQSTSSTKTQLI